MSTTLSHTARAAVRGLAITFASLALVAGAHAQGHFSGGGHGGASFGHAGPHGSFGHGGAMPHYYGHGGHWGGGPLWGGVGLGIGLGLGGYYASPWYQADPGYVVVDPPVVYSDPQAAPLEGAPVPAPESTPQPVIYPRNGQSPSQTDGDSNACSSWAGSQPNATVDASVFQRGFGACMDARGYTIR